VEAERDYQTAYQKFTAAQRDLELLEASVGATEQDIMAREADAQARLDDATGRLPHARSVRGTAHDGRVRAMPIGLVYPRFQVVPRSRRNTHSGAD